MEPRPGTDSNTVVIALRAPSLPEPLERKLRALGDLEPLAGCPGRFLLTAGPAKAKGKGKASRVLTQARAILGEAADVHPTLVDEDGHPVVPTGTVHVRFKAPPTDEELAAFAGPLGLTVEKRNAYAPSQVAFRPAEAAKEPLTELVDRIEKSDKSVQQAWPETLGRYRRE